MIIIGISIIMAVVMALVLTPKNLYKIIGNMVKHRVILIILFAALFSFIGLCLISIFIPDWAYEENKQIKKTELVSFTTDIGNENKSYYAIVMSNDDIILKTVEGNIVIYYSHLYPDDWTYVEESNNDTPKIIKYKKKPNFLWTFLEEEETIIYIPKDKILELEVNT